MTLYRAPFVLKDFQVEFIARALEQSSLCIGADCGMGKTHMAICTACMLLEDGQIDHVLLECEKGKLGEWEDDLRSYTQATVGVLSGGPEKRKTIIADLPQFILGVYETIRNEAAHTETMTVGGRKIKRLMASPLTDALRGKRVLMIWDEASAKIGADRMTAMYKHHEFMVKTLRKEGTLRMLPTTATPQDRDPEGWFNLARLLDPDKTGTVKVFEELYVDRDRNGRAVHFKCLKAEDTPPGILSLRDRTGHLIAYKSKLDPDVIKLFPEVVTNSDYVVLGERHQGFYEAVADSIDDTDWDQQRALFGVLRQIAGHPLSLVRSVAKAEAEGRDVPKVAHEITGTLGEASLRALGAAKLDRLVDHLRNRDAGTQSVIFTFYGQSILPIIHERLVEEGFLVSINHGGLSHPQRKRAQAEFCGGTTQIFLSSDAGCRGINLPGAQWVINYEMPLTHSIWWQRINRANRLDSWHPVTNVLDLVAKDTIEDGIVGLGLKRHAWSDALLADTEDGSNYLSAHVRQELMKQSRRMAA